jgi:WhiB family transcriptional regulator, redox-sensing transcriptional regulator
MQDHQPWRAHGKCATISPARADELFYIGKGKSPKAAKAFCAACPVRKQCLFFALYYNEEGIWAGTTDAERKEMRDFVMVEVELSFEVVYYIESRDLSDFIPPQEQSSLECA